MKPNCGENIYLCLQIHRNTMNLFPVFRKRTFINFPKIQLMQKSTSEKNVNMKIKLLKQIFLFWCKNHRGQRSSKRWFKACEKWATGRCSCRRRPLTFAGRNSEPTGENAPNSSQIFSHQSHFLKHFMINKTPDHGEIFIHALGLFLESCWPALPSLPDSGLFSPDGRLIQPWPFWASITDA